MYRHTDYRLLMADGFLIKEQNPESGTSRA
jgi:hypothetical protein